MKYSVAQQSEENQAVTLNIQPTNLQSSVYDEPNCFKSHECTLKDAIYLKKHYHKGG